MTYNHLLSMAKDANIKAEDVRKMYENMEKEILLSKYSFPTKPSTDGYFHIQVKDISAKTGRRHIKAKDIDRLKDKVYLFERAIADNPNVTFKQTFELALKQKTDYVKDPEKMLSVKNSVIRIQKDFNRYFAGTRIERMLVSDISKKDIEEVILSNLRQYDLTKKSFDSLCSIFQMVFTLAFQEYWIDDNPYNRVNRKKFKDMLVLPTPIEQRVHTDDEMERILAHIRQKQYQKPTYLPAYALEMQMIMGLRRGEIPPLRWVDVKERYILISKEQITVRGEGCSVVHHTKTWKDRMFPITDELENLLGRIKRAHQLAGIDSEYIFPAKSETGMMSNQTVYALYRRTCIKLGIPLSKDCIKGTHSFRRNAITKAANNSGGDMLLVSKIFGNSPKIAERHYYVGVDMEMARNAVQVNRG